MYKVENYGARRASEYDEESEYDKGNREQHVLLLKDVLSYKESTPVKVVELGCGTGFFTSVLLERYDGSDILLVDGSENMLEKAKEKFSSRPGIKFIHCFLQDINWDIFSDTDIVFSALTIHHLTDVEKQTLYRNIFSVLSRKGRFIYFDQFKMAEEEANLLLEYISCRDIQRKLRGDIPDHFYIKELDLPEIISNDRKVKANDNDKEANFIDTISQLRDAGFSQVIPVYQEARFFAIAAFK